MAELTIRLRGRGDVLLAAALALAALIQTAAAPIASTPRALLIALATTVPVAVRRTHPVLAALVTTAAGLVPSNGYVYVGYIVAFVVFYSVAAYVPDTRIVLVASAAGVALATAGSLIHHAVFGEYFGALTAVAAPALVGRFVWLHRLQRSRLEELARLLEAERDWNVARALADERRRIARELHDVVAHTISVIGVQADAAEAALDADPPRARRPLQAIRRSSADALTEMRRLLAVLRTEDEDDARSPQPSLAELPALLEGARRLGVDVTLEVRGDERPLSTGVDLSAYRIIQEALTNVGKHARGAATTVRLGWLPDALEVEVRDRGPGPRQPAGEGHGLVGMRERARIHGGSVSAAPAPEGGFRVVAHLPYA